MNTLVDSAVQRWQTQLLQLDRRNKLLYMKDDRTSVRLEPPGSADDFVADLSGSRLGRRFLYAARRPNGQVYEEPGDLFTSVPALDLQRRLRALRARDREFTEEQGVNVLFLAVGFLRWIDEDGEPGNAPLVLFPADLIVASPRDPYYLRLEDEDPVSNATLKFVLSKSGIVLPDFNPDSSVAVYLESVRRLTRRKPNWEVVSDIQLSTFQFSKVAMWEDLEAMREEGVAHPLVRRMAGDVTEPPNPDVNGPDELAEGNSLGGKLDDHLDVKRQYLVLPADASQVRAIEAARRGRHLVIHGPPGTGKSQTIANLISTFVADGKRILFVAEKTAALDVVKRRLDEANLGVFCLDLHSDRGKKANVYAQLRLSLEDRRAFRRTSFRHAELIQQRDHLNRLTRLLHEARQPLDRSIFQALGRFVALKDCPEVPFTCDPPEQLTPGLIATATSAASDVASYVDEFREHAVSPLRYLRSGLDVLSIEARARSAVENAEGALRQVLVAARETQASLGLSAAPRHIEDIRELISILDHLAGTPGVPAAWLDAQSVSRLSGLAESQHLDQKRRTSCRSTLERHFGKEDIAHLWAETDSTAMQLMPDAETARLLLGDRWSERLVLESTRIARAAELLEPSVERTTRAFDRLCASLGLKAHQRRTEAERLLAAGADIERVLPLPGPWFDEGAIDWRVDRAIKEAEAALHDVEGAEARLAEGYDLALVDLVDRQMLVRFRTEYRSFFKRLGGQFKSDMKLIHGSSRSGAKPSIEHATQVVEMALAVAAARTAWESSAGQCEALIGSRYRGRETDWAGVRAETALLRALIADRGLELERLQTVGTSPGRGELADCRQELSSALQELRSLELDIVGSAAPGTAPFDSLVRPLVPLRSPIVRIREALQAVEGQCSRLPADVAGLVDALVAARALLALEADAEARLGALAADFGAPFKGWETDWQRVLKDLEWTGELLHLCGGRVPKPIAEAAVEPARAAGIAHRSAELREALDVYGAGLKPLSVVFDPTIGSWNSWTDCGFEELADLLAALRQHQGRESSWLGYRRAAEALDRTIGSKVTDQARGITDDATLLPASVERRYLSQWLACVFQAEPALEQFSAIGQEKRLEAFERLDREMIRNAREEVRKLAFSRYPNQFVTHTNAGELGIVQGQVQRRRGHMPVRRLLARAPQVVQALKPCFMMSPLAVSQHLERGLQTERVKFDVVIFDEASQVFPEDAVPAISRAEQVIVVGDQKQLPPTSFFRRTDDDADAYDNPNADPDDDEDALAGRESVLDALLGVGAGVAQRFLDVHYRSRHEDLIRFSNHMFYRDRLLVFPSPNRKTSGLGLRDVYVKDGRYDSGATRTNPVEAGRVADIVFELMRTVPARESIGVVALSRAQAALIDRLVQERRMLNRDLDSRFSEEVPERFFVKNLENVQGDERDHIILSIGYGPTVATGRVPQRFGPINNDGGGEPSYGQRRLNVAVSRARRSFTVAHSMLATEITSDSRGAHMLRRFLDFAANPMQAFEAQQSFDPDAVPDSEFEDAVANALRLRGYDVQPQVGASGYRIDLAVWSRDHTRFDLGVECDGWTYHSSPAARDRDWLRQSILEDLGWKIHRVWSTSWARDPLGELEHLVAAIERARQAPEASAESTDPDDAPETSWTGDELTVVDEPGLSEPDDGMDAEETSPNSSHQGSAVLFEPYRPTRLPRRSGEIRFLTANQLQPQLTQVIRTEGPVHFEVILERLRDAYGAGRAGAASRDAVLSALQKLARGGSVKAFGPKDDQFYELPDWEVAARRAVDDESRRDPAHIHGTELRAGLLKVSSVIGACQRQELIRETWYQFGFERVGPEMQVRMGHALDFLLGHDAMIRTSDDLLRRSV